MRLKISKEVKVTNSHTIILQDLDIYGKDMLENKDSVKEYIFQIGKELPKIEPNLRGIAIRRLDYSYDDVFQEPTILVEFNILGTMVDGSDVFIKHYVETTSRHIRSEFNNLKGSSSIHNTLYQRTVDLKESLFDGTTVTRFKDGKNYGTKEADLFMDFVGKADFLSSFYIVILDEMAKHNNEEHILRDVIVEKGYTKVEPSLNTKFESQLTRLFEAKRHELLSNKNYLTNYTKMVERFKFVHTNNGLVSRYFDMKIDPSSTVPYYVPKPRCLDNGVNLVIIYDTLLYSNESGNVLLRLSADKIGKKVFVEKVSAILNIPTEEKVALFKVLQRIYLLNQKL